jgi:hypothetical protein
MPVSLSHPEPSRAEYAPTFELMPALIDHLAAVWSTYGPASVRHSRGTRFIASYDSLAPDGGSAWTKDNFCS